MLFNILKATKFAMQLLSAVLDTYLLTKAELNGTAFNIGSVDQKSLLEGLPKFFENILSSMGRLDAFKVEGSIGAGNMAKVPWVAVFNRSVTETAQDGYYIVLLFAEDMRSCYLSLNQGVTAFEKQFSRKLALAKMQAASQRAVGLNIFIPSEDVTVGPIDLRATASLGQGYESGAIESYFYDREDLPSEDKLKAHFLSLLDHYDRLVPVAGKSLQSLAPVSETEFQLAVLEKAASVGTEEIERADELTKGQPKRLIKQGAKTGWMRNARIAGLALARARFKCEVDPNHETFVSRARGRPYVEAHHLIPMSQQNAFDVSLDVTANIVALCATCHKLLHHGRAADKHGHLLKLLNTREERLKAVEIMLEKKELLQLYTADLPEDD